jgi:energy-coupling factor transport system ATP-binding protein
VRVVLERVRVEYADGPHGAAALDAVDVSVGEGECVALVGPTGSGKTTLLEVAAGLTAPTRGTARLEGAPPDAALRSAVGLVYQFPECQFFEETVFEDVAFGPRRQGLSPSEIEGRVRGALARASLDPDEFAGRHPLTLSVGEQRRAAVACILALERPFLLLDEPTAGLDPAGRSRVLDLVAGERARGRGLIVVTHDLDLADRTASRVVLLVEGRVLADGPSAAVLGDGPTLARAGLEMPIAHALVAKLRERGARDLDRVATAVLGSGPLAGAPGR